MAHRLLIVSNRLPVTIHKERDSFCFSKSSGGLYGWPGIQTTAVEFPEFERRLADECGARPVMLDDALAERHYNGFCNSVLWPWLHYYAADVVFEQSAWEAYQEANQAFADVIASDVQDGDMIWIHDYHLMLLPAMLRASISKNKQVKIGFFLHTPFPCVDTWRTLPVAAQITEALLKSDLIGFHTKDYKEHFARACSNLLGLTFEEDSIEVDGRTARIGTFPIGIDPAKFHDGLNNPLIQARIESLRKQFHNRKVFVGVDRMDYIKGLPLKLRAFGRFLEEYPEWQGKVVLIQVAVPSRESVDKYKQLCAEVDGIVGQVNGKYGAADYVPVLFAHHSVDFHELVALYAVADACIISSTRDGMNLVAYEYFACQKGRNPRLVLSEFAGAADALQSCLRINPYNVKQFADALHECVSIGNGAMSQACKADHRYIDTYTSEAWGKCFVGKLEDLKPKAPSAVESSKAPDNTSIRARLA